MSFELGTRDRANAASSEARQQLQNRREMLWMHPACIISRETDGTHTIGVYDASGNLIDYYTGVCAHPAGQYDAGEDVWVNFLPGESKPLIVSGAGGSISVALLGMITE